jgi:DNA-binding PadR family transcriptional regulator
VRQEGRVHGYAIAGQITTRHDVSRRRARTYELTAAGRKRLGEEEERWHAITAAVGHVLKHA